MERKNKPRWSLLYLTVPLMVILLILQGEMPSAPTVHEVPEMGIVLVCFGLMVVWVHGNQAALLNEQFEKERWELHTYDSEPDLDPRHLPLADIVEEPEQHPSDVQTSPTKGRYN